MLREREAAFAWHHDVEEDEVEGQAAHRGACCCSISSDCDAEAVFEEVAAKQVANLLVVIDNQDVGSVIRKRIGSPG
jgi:hypothetical protein